jgi:hypothetical protein
MSAHDMTPEQALDASIAAVSGAIVRSPKEVEQGVQLAELILGQIRWRGYDLVPSRTSASVDQSSPCERRGAGLPAR